MVHSHRSIPYIKDRDELILRHCTDKMVLHIGACDSPFTQSKLDEGLLLHQRLSTVAARLLGVDLDASAVALLEKNGISDVACADICSPSFDPGFSPDVIVFGETIEHLTDLDACFAGILKVMGMHASLIVSTPNILSGECIRNFVFSQREFHHADHRVGFTHGLLVQILSSYGLDVKQFCFTSLPRYPNGLRGRLRTGFWRAVARLRPGLAGTLFAVCSRQPRIRATEER